MIVNLGSNQPYDEFMGIPMMFPMTWEENVAANMTKIPLFELFPGLLVKDVYKAYRYGIDNKLIQPWTHEDSDDSTVAYLATVTKKDPAVIRDCLNAFVRTVAQGKASPDIIAATAKSGVEEKLPIIAADAATAVGKTVKGPMTILVIVGIGAALVYGMSIGILPKPKFEANK